MSKTITVGIDIRDLRIAKTGAKTYLEELLRVLRKMDTAEFKFVFFDTQLPIYTGKNNFLKIIEHLRFIIWKQVVLPVKALSKGCDILFCTDYFLPYFTPGLKTFVVFYDAFFYEYPAQYNAIWLKLFKWMAVPAAKKATRVITITEYSKKRISHFTGIKSEKITAIHLAPKTMAIAKLKKGYIPSIVIPANRFILHVGVLEKRKNLVRIIEAFKLLRDRGYRDHALVLVGQPSPKNHMDDSKEIKETIKKLNLDDQVVMSGYASDEDLAYFYENAEMYVFPSVNEGFGLPVLEAFHHRIPVVLANNTCLPEVGGDAVLSFDPYDVPAIAAQIQAVMDDPQLRAEMVRKGEERLKLFSWKQNVEELLKLFSAAMHKN